jgi:hypothetical protein
MPTIPIMYAYQRVSREAGGMAQRSALKRKSFFVDEQALRRARKVLGVTTDAEVVRLSVARVSEMETFWRFMTETRRSLKRGSLKSP